MGPAEQAQHVLALSNCLNIKSSFGGLCVSKHSPFARKELLHALLALRVRAWSDSSSGLELAPVSLLHIREHWVYGL